MTYGELKDLFQKRLNRRDVTPTLVDSFLKDAIQRTQRLLRTPGSEVATEVTIDETYDGLAVPGDFLQLVSLVVDDYELRRVSLHEAIGAARSTGQPRVFARNRNQFVLGPRPLTGANVTIVYYADFSNLVNPEDTNWLTEVAPDVIIDGALADACEHFNDPRGDRFEASFTRSIVDLNNMALQDELTNAAIMPTYRLNFDEEEGL